MITKQTKEYGDLFRQASEDLKKYNTSYQLISDPKTQDKTPILKTNYVVIELTADDYVPKTYYIQKSGNCKESGRKKPPEGGRFYRSLTIQPGSARKIRSSMSSFGSVRRMVSSCCVCCMGYLLRKSCTYQYMPEGGKDVYDSCRAAF